MAITISGDVATTKTNLGLGTAADLDVGTSANQVIQLDGSGNLPAVGGANLTGISSAFNAPAFYVNNSNNFTITDATNVTLTTELDAVTLNTDSCYNSTTGRWTPNVAGWYHFEAQLHGDAGGSQLINIFSKVYRGGGGTGDGLIMQSEQQESTSNANEQSSHVSGLVQMNGTTDYLYLVAYADDTSGSAAAAANHCNFMGWLVYPT